LRFAEGDARRIAAMLAANAELDVWPGRPATLGREAYELADPGDIEADEGVAWVDALLDIDAEELRGVVARNAERRLRQVVGAEGEEPRLLGDFAGHQRGARQLDHRADEIFQFAPLFGENLGRHPVDQR